MAAVDAFSDPRRAARTIGHRLQSCVAIARTLRVTTPGGPGERRGRTIRQGSRVTGRGTPSYRVVGFVEGARQDSGSVGLVGVPLIHRAMARRGHRDMLFIVGPTIPTVRQVLEAGHSGHPARDGVPAIHVAPGVGRWSFNAGVVRTADAAVRDADIVTLHSLYSFPVLLGYLLARRHRKPYGLWPHGVLAPFQRTVSRGRKAAYGLLVARRMLDRASVLFFSAAGERDEARSLGLHAPSVVIPHGLDVAEFEVLPSPRAFRERFMDGHDGPVVLFLSRVNAKKGLDLLIEALPEVFARFPDARCAIVGGAHPPAFLDEVRRWIAAAGVTSRVTLTGPLTDAQRVEAFAAADVFVLPSQAENFGFAMFEAMAAGVPVVVSDTLNYAWEVRQNAAGIVVPRTAPEFAAAIVSVLGAGPAVRARYGEHGRRVAATYSWDTCGARIESVVSSVLNRTELDADLQPEPAA